jgi:lipoprotein-anchoring transpeptidase ErfK/SrfK
MKWLLASCIALFTLVSVPVLASSSMVARIDLSEQTMRVYVDGVQYYTWRVSTARRGYRTPVGRYRPKVLKRMHYSSIYDNAPMPYSIFFKGGYAVHGTDALRSLGRPASHGCVRLDPSNARELFQMVRYFGMENSRIEIGH